jgi:capsid assembly protease
MESNPYEALSDKAKRSIQQSVDYHASAFIEHVVQSRGMEEADVRATEARCFDPPEALEAGLIDAVQSPADAISSFLGSLNGGSSTMQTTQNNGGSTTAATAPGMSAADIAKLVAETVSASLTTALPTALAAHDKAKTERRAAIMGCDEAKSRQKFAAHLADNTSMTVDEAKALLANAAEEKPQQTGRGTGRSPFHEAMDRTQNPHVGADSEGNGGGDPDNGGGGESDMAVASRILDTYASHTGNKVVPIKKTA